MYSEKVSAAIVISLLVLAAFIGWVPVGCGVLIVLGIRYVVTHRNLLLSGGEDPRARGRFGFVAASVGIAAIVGLWSTLALSRPPIHLALRPSLVGLGHVLTIYNTSTVALSQIRVSMFNSKTGQSAAYEIPLLGPKADTSVGWRECAWVFERDELITIAIDGYRRAQVSTNELFP
jgi:hypothetical protein